MIPRTICQILGRYLFYMSLALCLPLLAAVYYEFFADPRIHPQPHTSAQFLVTLAISLALSLTLRFIGRSASGQIFRRESILVVVLIWLSTSFISALPFYISGTLTNPLDAYFEAMSGITTTGATLLAPKAYDPHTGDEIPIHITNPQTPQTTYTYFGTVAPIRDPQTGVVLYSGVEAVGKAVLLWRSFLQWIGGMGIVVIFLTVLPALGVGGKFLYQMEMTGPIKEGIRPRVQETASRLWKLYLLLTLTEIALLLWTNEEMPLFDAVCIALSNISTGGFSVRNDSIASYQSVATEWIVLLFMIFGSINFTLYFKLLQGKFSKIPVPDFVLFLTSALVGCLLVSAFLFGTQNASLEGSLHKNYTWGQALREGSFQALSAQTSTGFVTANYDLWPFPSQMFLLLLMFVGGMSGSTAGGIKTSRFYILYKIVLNRLESIYRPDTIRKLHIGQSEVDDKNALTVLSFFCIAIFFTALGTVLLILEGIDPETSLGLVACFLNNTGIAFRAAGPADAFNFLSPLAKILSIGWMLLGRLEFYIVLILFLPSFWKNR